MKVNKRELAEIVGYSERAITEWQDAGMPIEAQGDRGEANTYETADVVRWLIARESGKERAESEKERLTRLQADQIELDMSIKRRDLVPASELEPVWARLAEAAKSYLRSQAVPLVQTLELTHGEEAKVQLVTERFDEFLTRLSNPDLPDGVELVEESASQAGAAAEAGAR